MRTVTATEYSKKVGLYQTIARREPIVITSHGREETVLISADEYRRLTRRRRRPFLIEELPEEDWQAIEQARAEAEKTESVVIVAALPRPTSGLVIGYSYLWEAAYRAGREEGTKDRPCAVVIATRTEDGDIVVTVAPVTYSVPARTQDGLELPAEVKRVLGLDTERCWLICSELNRFVWPGPDLRPISRRAPGNFVYGMLPSPFMRQVFQRLALLRTERRLHVVFRLPWLLCCGQSWRVETYPWNAPS